MSGIAQANSTRMGYEPERTEAAASIPLTYGLIGALFTHPIRILVLQNGTNEEVQFSLDGSTCLITLQPNVSIVIDITAARSNNTSFLCAPMNEGVYAQYVAVAPTTGAIYASAIYGYSNSY